jgi:Fe2+ or Zn2+ uptake regulation protein
MMSRNGVGTLIATQDVKANNTMSSQRVEAEVMRLLARYYRDNPLACDTAEGASRWWLPQEPGLSETMVVTALEKLVALGALETLNAIDGRVRYRHAATPAASRALDRIIRVLQDSQRSIGNAGEPGGTQ